MTAPAPGSDVSIELNQLELPEDFDESDLAALRAELNRSGLRADVVVEPTSAPRDFIIVPTLIAIHFLSAHGVDMVLGVAEGAFWDGIKAAVGRLRGRQAGASAPDRARVTVRYQDGPTIEIDVTSAEQLRQVLNDIVPADQRRPSRPERGQHGAGHWPRAELAASDPGQDG